MLLLKRDAAVCLHANDIGKAAIGGEVRGESVGIAAVPGILLSLDDGLDGSFVLVLLRVNGDGGEGGEEHGGRAKR